MKKFFILITTSIFSLGLMAQLANSKVDKAVYKLKNTMSLAGDSASIVDVNNQLENLVTNYPTDWRAFFWAVKFKIEESRFYMEDSLKQDCFSKADTYFLKLDAFAETDPDVLCLKALLYHTKLTLLERNSEEYRKILALQNSYLATAYAEDPGNPHYYYLKSEFLYEENPTPSGAIKTEILKYLDNAMLQFKARKSKQAATPQFGIERAEVLLNFIRNSSYSDATEDFDIGG